MQITEQNMLLEQAGETATLEEHQRALYILLCEFHRVCAELNIPYFLFAGTLLGAVRHKGFIPWDDDLDIIMLRKDYERFLREAPKVLNQERFFLQKEFSQHWPMFFSKLRLNGTTCLEKYHPKDPQIHQGVYMDIFPCDHAFGSSLGRKVQFFCSKVVIAKGLDAEGYVTDSIVKKIFMVLCRLVPRKPFMAVAKGPRKTDYVHCFLGGASKYTRSVFPRAYFDARVLLPFGEQQFYGPEQYDALLKTLYEDYWIIPEEADRECKQHAILVDLHRPHEHYKDYRKGMKFEIHTRSIR